MLLYIYLVLSFILNFFLILKLHNIFFKLILILIVTPSTIVLFLYSYFDSNTVYNFIKLTLKALDYRQILDIYVIFGLISFIINFIVLSIFLYLFFKQEIKRP